MIPSLKIYLTSTCFSHPYLYGTVPVPTVPNYLHKGTVTHFFRFVIESGLPWGPISEETKMVLSYLLSDLCSCLCQVTSPRFQEHSFRVPRIRCTELHSNNKIQVQGLIMRLESRLRRRDNMVPVPTHANLFTVEDSFNAQNEFTIVKKFQNL